MIDHDDTGIEIQPNGLFLVVVNGKAVRRNMTFTAAMELLDAYENIKASSPLSILHEPRWLTMLPRACRWN